MLPDQIEALAGAFREAAAAVVHARAGSLGDEAIALPEVTLERPRQAAHGDLACNLAMQLARPLRARKGPTTYKIHII
jgi:arginyl-tRNA synthetase